MGRLSKFFNCKLNSVLINRYKTGQSHISWHRDDEPELGERPTIISLSLGDTRSFEIKKNNCSNIIKFKLCNGTLIVMKGDMQKQWRHQVPIDSSTGVRLNFTFRHMKPL